MRDLGAGAVPTGYKLEQRELPVQRGNPPCGLSTRMEHAKILRKESIGCVLHRNFDHAPLTGAFALVKRGHDCRIKVDARAEIAQGHPRLDRRFIRKLCGIDDATHGLHHKVHRWIVAIGAGLPITGAQAGDPARINLMEIRRTDPEAVSDARSEVHHKDIGAADHLAG
jgi:hypothetical protein